MLADEKGREFRGMASGAPYRRWAAVFCGMTDAFYDKAVGRLAFRRPIKVLDLGCGPGSMTFALAAKAPSASEIHGIDISEDQLRYARAHTQKTGCSIEFHKASMDELPFPDASFDMVMSSMALHETPPQVRRAAISETARILRPDGLFLLVDWSRPRFGLYGAIWLPLIAFAGRSARDNWDNTYRQICLSKGLSPTEDHYINSLVRRQVFRKKVPSDACGVVSVVATT
jgi:demethylmenaquinone methyltransferase/2-methoxy-6-polyprenyl-1,4-benzoquinol methylase